MPAKIDTVKDHQSGIEVPIYLDKKTLIFSAKFADWATSDRDGHKVRSEALAAIRERAALEWIPVIKVNQTRNSGSVNINGEEKSIEEREDMGLRIERFYVARRHDGYWVRVNWYVEPQNRMANGKNCFDVPKGATEIIYSASETERPIDRRTEGTYTLPYDANLWLGLTEIIRQMKRIRQVVTDLLTSPAGIDRLIAAGSDVPLLK